MLRSIQACGDICMSRQFYCCKTFIAFDQSECSGYVFRCEPWKAMRSLKNCALSVKGQFEVLQRPEPDRIAEGCQDIFFPLELSSKHTAYVENIYLLSRNASVSWASAYFCGKEHTTPGFFLTIATAFLHFV